MFRSSLKWKWALAALVATLGGTSAYAQNAACQVNYTQAWSNGNVAHGANVEIRNLGPAINGWTLTFNFAGGQTLQNGWPVAVTQSGTTLTAQSTAPWNANIATNGSFTVGMNLNGPFNPAPSSFSLNGVVCGGGGGQNTGPTISISAPANNSTINAASFAFSATAADTNTGGAIQRVEFRVNGALVATDTAAPYTTTVTTTTLLVGANTLQATAFDNGVPAPVISASASVTVTRPAVNGGNTPPTVSVTAPTAGQVFPTGTTTVTLSATAADTNTGGGVANVQFLIDGVPVGAADIAAPYSVTVAVAPGAHTAQARATDNGVPAPVLVTTSAAVNFTIPGIVQPALQAVPTSVSVPSGGTAQATIRRNTAPTANVPVTILRTSGSTEISAAPLALTLTPANGATGLPVTFSAAAGTTAVSAVFTASAPGHTPVAITVTRTPAMGGNNALFRVNANGRVTKNGTLFPVHCGAWFGMEGRHEPSNDQDNPRGAPMEQYVGNSFFANGGSGTGRTIAQTMSQIAGMGINVIRVPLVPQMFQANNPQGVATSNGRRIFKNHASVIQPTSRAYLNQMITAADAANIEVMLDIHSCSNFVGWRKGRLDARPPWVDRDRENYDFKREDASCSATGNPAGVTQIDAYNTSLWLENLRTLAGIGGTLGVDNIFGIDIYNEPHDYTWAEWKSLTEQAFAAINAINPNILLVVEGIGTTPGVQDGSPTTFTQEPHGNVATNPNWGENLFSQNTTPLAVPKDRLVFSPHTYGPSVFVQKMFMDPAQTACTGLEGDAAGDLDCRIVINPTLLRSGWEEHFGYLKQQGFAIVVGEFGGNMDWPLGQANLRDRARWSHITTNVDQQWQDAFVDYMVEKDIEGCYWSINPESGDTAGWYGHAYNPISNPGGWGEWQAFDARKTTLLNRLWQGVP